MVCRIVKISSVQDRPLLKPLPVSYSLRKKHESVPTSIYYFFSQSPTITEVFHSFRFRLHPPGLCPNPSRWPEVYDKILENNIFCEGDIGKHKVIFTLPLLVTNWPDTPLWTGSSIRTQISSRSCHNIVKGLYKDFVRKFAGVSKRLIPWALSSVKTCRPYVGKS
jgi:hypothetical protein